MDGKHLKSCSIELITRETMFNYNEMHIPVFNLKRKHLGPGDGSASKAACGQAR